MAGKSRKRRAKGDGSLWELKSGSWRAEVPLGPGKKPLRKVFRGPTAHQDARAWKTATAAARDAKTLAGADAGTTINDRIDSWLAGREGAVEPRTLDTDRQVLDKLVRPTAGPVRLADLTADWGRRWADALAADPGMTADKRRRAIKHLKAVFAADVGSLLPANPLARVKPPRRPNKPVPAYTKDQAVAILKAARGVYTTLLRLAFDSGLRPGELLALRWEDVAPDCGSITVRRAIRNVRGKLSEKPPKTAAGRRTVLLTPATAAALSARPRGSGLVFATRAGGWLHPRNVARGVRLTAIRAGQPALGLKACRHTSATLLLAAGAPIKAVSMRLGHESIEITLKFYAASLPEDQERCRQAAEAVFG